MKITIEFYIFKLIYNPGQNTWHKVRKCSKIGLGYKNSISNYACFLNAFVKFSYWSEDWALGYVSTSFFLTSPNILVLNLFGDL